MSDPIRATVQHHDQRFDLDPLQAFTFGRAGGCTLVIGRTDRSVSREAGRIAWDGTGWTLVNSSTSRPLYVVDGIGLRRPLAVGAAEPLPSGPTRVVVLGSHSHELTVTVDRPLPATEVDLPGPDDATAMPALTSRELVALVALAEGYLLPHPHHDPAPRTYAAAAARLRLSETTVRKRVENVRRKLLDAGVFQLETADARAPLVEFLLSVRLVTTADLALLDARVSGVRQGGDGAD